MSVRATGLGRLLASLGAGLVTGVTLAAPTYAQVSAVESPVQTPQAPTSPQVSTETTQAQVSRETTYAEASPGVELRFPRDEGAHPYFRIEWW